MTPAVTLLTLLALAADPGALAPAAPAPAAPAVAPAADDGFLVWTSVDPGGKDPAGPGERTVWLNAAGRELAARDGLWLAHGGRLWRLETRRESVALPSCARLEAEDPSEAGDLQPDAGKLEGLYLVPTGAGAGKAVAVRRLPKKVEEGTAELEERVFVTAAVGPYLFVETRSDSYACGAHGDTAATAFVFDLTTGAPTKALAPSERELARLEKLARARFQEESEEEDEPLDGDESPDASGFGLAASVPVWAKGRLALRHLWWAEACYACGDGAWESYTTTTEVPSEVVPPALAEHGTLPAPVAARLEAAGEKRAGVSRAPAALKAAFAAK